MLHFKEAIFQISKAKSHAKVGYQDHPNGDKQCSGCSMFVPGSPPGCTHVAPPIVAQGYCDDYVALDPNERARRALGPLADALSVGIDDKGKIVAKSFDETIKAFSPDEPRDEKGMWTSEGGGIPSGSGSKISDMSDISSHIDRVDDARMSLDEANTSAETAEEDAQAHVDEHGEEDHNLETAAAAAQGMAAQAAVDLHQKLSDLHNATAEAMDRIEAHLASHGITRIG